MKNFLQVGIVILWAASAHAAQTEEMEYDITWVGVSVGTMAIRSEIGEDGEVFRSVRIWNRPWIARIYPVDNTVECRIESTPQGPRHVVTKRMGEKNFHQDDTLTVWPEVGQAVWRNTASNRVHTFDVPVGARDFVSFFFDLRDAAGDGSWAAGGEYQLVMDDQLHALEIQVGEASRIRSPRGRLVAVPVKALSKSPDLFSRNRPKAVWVAKSQPVVMHADVESRFGTVRATLASWKTNGVPVEW